MNITCEHTVCASDFELGAELFRSFYFFWLLGGTVVVGGPGTGKNSAEMHVRMGRTQKLL